MEKIMCIDIKCMSLKDLNRRHNEYVAEQICLSFHDIQFYGLDL